MSDTWVRTPAHGWPSQEPALAVLTVRLSSSFHYTCGILEKKRPVARVLATGATWSPRDAGLNLGDQN